MDNSLQLRRLTYASLMAALTAAGAWIALPIGPVPIVLQNFFILLTGLLLGSRWGIASVGVYLFAGVLGFPVFAGGMGGIGRIFGPTGGYLLGYLPAVFVIGWVSERMPDRWIADVAGMLLGTALVYTCGVFWLKTLTGMSLQKTLVAGCYPFLPGDIIKIAAAVPVARILRPVIAHEYH